MAGPNKNIFDYAELKYHKEMENSRFKVYIQNDSLVLVFIDEMAELLR